MRVFKTTYKDKKGRTREASKWYVEFRDHLDTVRRLPAFNSKAASEEIGRNLEKLVSYHRSSGGQVDPALTRWLSALPQAVTMKLADIGLLDRERVAASKTLADHMSDFAKDLAARGNSSFHVEVVTGRVRRLVEGCGFRWYGDIKASKVMQYLNGLRADTEKKRGISAQTFNFYLGSLQQFCRWMVKDRRANDNPVAHLKRLNVATDRRRDRRPFTISELIRLLDRTCNGLDRKGMTGPERALAYRVAVETGLRSAELRSLKRASFDLDGDPATVTVLADYSKRRRQDRLPLRPELVAELRPFLATMTPATQVFKLPKDRKEAAEMFQADLEAAGIPYRDDAGLVADFHALRHTFITNLARSGVHPKVAQSLARHSTITLTMDRYSHTAIGEEVDAVAKLPDLSAAGRQELRATGTDDANAGQKNLASCLALSERFSETGVGAGGRERKNTRSSQTPSTLEETAGLADNFGSGSVCTSGGGPGLQNQWTA